MSTVSFGQKKLVSAARAMLAGDMEFLEGVRELDAWRDDAPDPEDEMFYLIIVAAHDAEGIPYEKDYGLYNPDYLKSLLEKKDQVEAFHRVRVLQSCKDIIKRISIGDDEVQPRCQ